MKKSIHLLLFLLLLTSCKVYSQDNSGLINSLITKIEAYKETTKVNSLIAGVWKGEEELFTIALGESMTLVPADVDMHLRIGGVSEIFQGVLLMMLVEQGKIGLDDKISKWLPDLLAADSVTVGMLIKNAGGYKDYVLNEAFVDLILSQPFRQITHQEILDYSVGDGQLNFRPGTKQTYSHTEFTILEDVLVKATGKTMPELFEENIFKPLNLRNTGYSITTDLPSPVLHAYSNDRGIFEDATFWNPSWTGGSGPLYSNIRDIAKFSYMFGTGKLINEESHKILISQYKGLNQPQPYFASGFAVYNGWFFQNPSFNGFSGAFGFQPDGEYTVIVYSTIGMDTETGAKAFPLLKELVSIITPDKPLNF